MRFFLVVVLLVLGESVSCTAEITHEDVEFEVYRDSFETKVHHLYQRDSFERTFSQIPLSDKNRAQFFFTIHSNTTVFDLSLDENVRDPEKAWKINLVLERVYCEAKSYEYGKHATLVFHGKGEEGNNTKSLMLCDGENDTRHWKKYMMDDVTAVTVWVDGDFERMVVHLVASVYYEVQEGCGFCLKDGYFCCGESKGTGMSRCINSTLVCNRHPNCGFVFDNVDESQAVCYKQECFGPNCDQMHIVSLVAVLVLFCILIPPLLILLACRFDMSRNYLQNLPVRLNCLRLRPRTAREEGVRPRESCGSQSNILASFNPTQNPSISEANPRVLRDRRARLEVENHQPPPSYEEAMGASSSSLHESGMSATEDEAKVEGSVELNSSEPPYANASASGGNESLPVSNAGNHEADPGVINPAFTTEEERVER